MRALKFVVAGGVAVAALMSAAPAAAQYYPSYGYPGYGYGGGNVVGQVLNQVLGGGYGGYGYGANSQAAISQCTAAVQQRLSGGYNGYGNEGYGYNEGYAYGGGRVLGVSRVESRSNGGLIVRGVATSGQYAGGYGGYAGGYGGQGQVDLTWKCKTDYRGFISDIDIDRAQRAYGSNYAPYNNGYGSNYSPYNNGYDYSQYGYRRY
jgi:hypothetical protein